jgi:transposase
MSRPRKLSSHFFNTDFKVLYKRSKGAEKQRYLGLHHVQQGKTYQEVADIILVKKRAVIDWVKRFESGESELKDKPGRGRKAGISASEREVFQEEIINLQNSRKGGRVKAKDIVAMAKSKFGIVYSVSGIYKVLERMKVVWVTGRSIHPKANLAAQAEFKKTSPKQ